MPAVPVKPSSTGNSAHISAIPCLAVACLLLLAACAPAASERAPGQPGIIDLRSWDFRTTGVATLDGLWEVFPRQLVYPLDLQRNARSGAPVYAPVPGEWRDIAGYSESFGTVTYRVSILLPPDRPDTLAIQTAYISGAIRLYVDGVLRKTAGQADNDPELYRPAPTQGLISLPVSGDRIELLMQIANFSELQPGVNNSFLIGSLEALTRQHDLATAREISIFASLVVLGLFLLLFFFFRNFEPALLSLAFFAILMGLRYLFLGSRFPYVLFPDFDWEFFEKSHYICYYLGVSCFLQFIQSSFPRARQKLLAGFSWLVSGGFTLITLVLSKAGYERIAPAYHLFAGLVMAYCLLLIILAIRERKPDAWLYFISTLFLVGGALVDTVFFYMPVNAPNVTSPMVVVFLFMQAILLSWRFNADFKLSRNLSGELRRILRRQDQVQEGLERTVIDRTHALSEALEQATVANKAKTEFLANISHEIRTPLNAIIGVCEIMIESHHSGVDGDSLRLILAEATRLLQMMNQLLDISKIEANKLVLEKHPFDCREMFDTIETTMKLRTVSSDVRFSLRVDPSVPRYVRGDPLRLRQILDNLLGNALKFTENGSISLEARGRVLPDHRIELHCTIADTGIGISAERQPTIFENFQQADSSTTRIYGGSGLGTSISRSLVELMDGGIALESESGKGSRFMFTVRLEAASETELPGGHLRDHQTEPFWQTAPRVLLVEDYLLNAEIIARHLSHAGWLVTTATNGRMAVDSFFEDTFDLVLMDINMPIMDGLEATRQIRQRSVRRVPVIGLSASAFKEDHERCGAAGMDELIAKPVRRLPLLEALARFVPPGSYVENATSHLNQTVARLLPSNGHHLLKDLDGDLALFMQMIFGFVKESRQNLGRIQDAMAQGDRTVLHRLAHTIKGGALNLGASAIGNAALGLEHAAKQGEPASWDGFYRELDEQIRILEVIAKRDK